jgi:hypothetical protein
MIGSLSVCVAIIAVMLQVSVGDQAVDQPEHAAAVASAVVLTVIDEAGMAHSISSEEFSRLPRSSAKVTTRGEEAEFAGTSLVELLKSCGVGFGKDLRGRRAPTVAILEATDEYRVVVSLLEIDPDTNDKVAIIADSRDGNPLSDQQGPFRLILPGDKREVRWIRNVRTIRVMNLRDISLEGPVSLRTAKERE